MPSSEKREVRQCTYTPIRNHATDPGHVPEVADFQPGQPFLKGMILNTGFLDEATTRRILPGIVKELHGVDRDAVKRIADAVAAMWRHGSLEAARRLRSVPLDVVTRVAKEAVNARRTLLQAAAGNTGNMTTGFGNAMRLPVIEEDEGGGSGLFAASYEDPSMAAFRRYLLNNPIRSWGFMLRLWERDSGIIDSLADLARIEPVGMLHLERITFDPVGYRRGELVHSVPLTPGETIRLIHREWTRTEREFQSSTRTSLETEVEDSLSEKTELTESLQTQRQHNTAFNTAVSASGSYGPVSITASVGYNVTDSESSSREQSASRTKELTSKAASRSKKEHKISFRTTEEKKTETENYRELRNEGADPVRWDFHRVLKLWDVSLYRYGLRLTYDLVLPEPGSYMLRHYIRMRQIEDALKEMIPLDVRMADIQPHNWERLAETHDVALDPPPAAVLNRSFGREITLSRGYFALQHLEIKVPDGYAIDPDRITATGAGIVTEGGSRIAFIDPMEGLNRNRLRAGGATDPAFLWRFLVDGSNEADAREGVMITLTLDVTLRVTESALNAWRAKNYDKLLSAHQIRQEMRREQLEEERDALNVELHGTDPLILRKMEKEEIMKGVLRFLLGPDFRFYPGALSMLEDQPDNEIGLYDPRTGALRPGVTASWVNHGEVIRFLHHAIEWENVNYVMYPYFWSDTDRWDIMQRLHHEDFVHRNFLRAGAARVVLTIRPGYEDSFLSFMETADTEDLLPADHPYMTIAEEMKALAQTRYPYTPGTSVENPENLVDSWQEFTPTGALDVMRGAVLDE